MARFVYLPILLIFLMLHSSSAQAACNAQCPLFANCTGSCQIDAGVGTGCSTVCLEIGCSQVRCQLAGSSYCTEGFDVECTKWPGKRVPTSPSPLESRWAVLEIDESSPFSTAARGVLAASSGEYGPAALSKYWQRENERRAKSRPDSPLNPSRIRTIFNILPTGIDPLEMRFVLDDESAKPAVPAGSHYYFRAATDSFGRISMIESLFTNSPGSEAVFENFVIDQYRPAPETMHGESVFFYGSIWITADGQMTRGVAATSRALPEDLQKFQSILDKNKLN